LNRLPGRAALAALVVLAGLSGAGAAGWAAEPGVHVVGSPHAPVTVTEFASVGCPHCAEWANAVYPAFKKAYIDTGKVKFEFHEAITGDAELAVAGFLVADCAPPDKYFQVVDAIFADQEGVARGGGVALLKLAEGAGLTPAQFDACLTNHQALSDLQARTDRDAEAHKVTGTPTFFIDGARFEGEPGLKELGDAIARAEHPAHGG
jgi:protein-disulfide isomerase